MTIATNDFDSQKNSNLPEAYYVKNVASKIVRIVIGMNDVIKSKVWGRKLILIFVHIILFNIFLL